MLKVHPYEEDAFDIFPLLNEYQEVGEGLMGELENEITQSEFLTLLEVRIQEPAVSDIQLLRQNLLGKLLCCGGSGNKLIKEAIKQNADAPVSVRISNTTIFFIDPEQIFLADIGHYETGQFTIELLCGLLTKKFNTFAFHKNK
ncbi:MAG: Nif3-like dinuclear metal center hexameric protein [Anaerotruncus sp.]|nr:Nif3-like dinuclear metal center hexameric protein [Anaerotruncus sp.]